VWDTNELFDLQKDPYEMNNLIKDTAYRKNRPAIKRRTISMAAANKRTSKFP
jgi:hypothetical protein